MQFLDKLFGPQTRNFERALDRTTQRHALLTDNLANVNVPGYKRRDVEFGVVLEAAEGSRASRFETLRSRLGSHELGSQGSVRVDGNGVDMEKEVVSIGETELRYELLTEITANYFSGLKSVIREGR